MRKLLPIIFVILTFSVVGQKPRSRPPVKPKPATIPQASPSPTPIPSPEKTKPAQQDEELLFSNEPFTDENFNWSTVSPFFSGNDFTSIFKYLLGFFKDKDEFETTADYQKRIAESLERNVIGNLKPNSQMSFRYNRVNSQYDADSQTLTVTIPITSVSVAGDKTKSYAGIDTKEPIAKSLGSYESQNGFGAKVIVEKGELYQFIYAFSNLRDFKKYNSGKYGVFNDFEVKLKLPPDKAREVKPNLEYLIVVQPQKPFAGIDVIKVEPKFTSPRDLTGVKSFISGELKEIWLFNGKTGEVLEKIKAASPTFGTLSVISVVRNDEMILLRKSLLEILKESGAQPIEQTKGGFDIDLIMTFLTALKKKDSKKYEPFRVQVEPVLQKYFVRSVSFDSSGFARETNVPNGKYFIFGGWTNYAGTFLWDKQVEINGEEIQIRLDGNNADCK